MSQGSGCGLQLLVAAFGLVEIAEHRRQLELGQPPIGDVADIGFDVARRHALDLAQAEGEIDEALLQLHHRLGDIEDVVAHRLA